MNLRIRSLLMKKRVQNPEKMPPFAYFLFFDWNEAFANREK
jgi:hypothetical protein